MYTQKCNRGCEHSSEKQEVGADNQHSHRGGRKTDYESQKMTYKVEQEVSNHNQILNTNVNLTWGKNLSKLINSDIHSNSNKDLKTEKTKEIQNDNVNKQTKTQLEGIY